jgi:hypothetical protein
VNKTIIAKTDTGDVLYQLGVSANPETVGLAPDLFSRVVRDPNEKEPTWAFGYVEYSDGSQYDVKDIASFLAHSGWFQQVADINFTVEG